MTMVVTRRRIPVTMTMVVMTLSLLAAPDL